MNDVSINIIGIVVNILVICLAKFHTYFSQQKKRMFTYVACFLLMTSFFAGIEALIVHYNYTRLYFLLNIMQAIVFCGTPVLPVLFIAISVKIPKKVAWKLSIPYFINAGFNISAIFTNSVFHFFKDLSYVHGPLYFIPIIVAVYSLVIAIHYIIKSLQCDSYAELVFFIAIFIASGFSFLLEFLTSTTYLFYNMVAVFLIGYFAALSIIDNRKDNLTNTYNRFYFDSFINEINGSSNALIVMYDCNDLKKINDTRGHTYGDQMLKLVGSTLIDVYGKHGRIFRYGGDEFFVIITRESKFQMIDDLKNKFNEILAQENISVACGSVYYDRRVHIDTALKKVDDLMYKNKKEIKENA